jgi:hypothetical protein
MLTRQAELNPTNPPQLASRLHKRPGGKMSTNQITHDDDHWPEIEEALGLTQPEPLDDFWEAREVLRHIRDFARARRVGPWALLGCVLVRVVAATITKIVIPTLTGGQVSLNLYAGIVAFTGGGKGTADQPHTKRSISPTST